MSTLKTVSYYTLLNSEKSFLTLNCVTEQPEKTFQQSKQRDKERFSQLMNNYVYLTKKELFRPTDFVTYNVQ